jgi:urea transport system substrate-binding protein
MRRRLWLAAGVVITVGCLAWLAVDWFKDARKPILVGILHSQTGPMAISEKSMIDAEVLAIEEINAAGGLLGRPIEAVIRDGASDWPT